MACSAALADVGACASASQTRHWFLADRVGDSRAQPGFSVDVRLGGVPNVDSSGRIAHVRGVMISATGVFNCGQANDPVSAYQLRGLFNAFVLEDVTGHVFWPTIDARALIDDVFFRHWSRIDLPSFHYGFQGPIVPGNPPASPYHPFDYPAGDFGLESYQNGNPGAQVPVGFYVPLVTLGAGQNPLAGLIPLAALQKRSNEGAFRFRINASIPGSPAGVTFTGLLNGEGSPGLDVWLDVVYLPALVVDPGWTVDSYTLPDSSGRLRRPEQATEHAQIRYWPEDQPGGAQTGFESVNNLDLFTLEAGSFASMSGMTAADATMRMLAFYASEPTSAMARRNAANDLPILGDPAGIGASIPQAMTLLPFRQRGAGEAAGPVNFRYGVMGSNAWVRYLHRTVKCNDADRLKGIADAAQCSPCSAVPTDTKGSPTPNAGQFSTLVLAKGI